MSSNRSSSTPPPPPRSTGSATSTPTSPAKKPRVSEASAIDATVLHQESALHWGYSSSTTSNHDAGHYYWYGSAVSSLYVITLSDPQQLALHLRRSCRVKNIQIHKVELSTNNTDPQQQPQLQEIPCRYHHADPLQHVLFPSAATAVAYMNERTNNNTIRLDADFQSSRGAMGMTNGLRAASIASNLGELRILIDSPQPRNAVPTSDETSTAAAVTAIASIWKQDLENNRSELDSGSRVARRLWQRLDHRSEPRRSHRFDWVAQQLAEASANAGTAYKLTITYDLPTLHHSDDDDNNHVISYMGLHASSSSSSNCLYTTCGTYGDHQGPRLWLPVFDSAAAHHRASHVIQITVTALAQVGLSVLGCGEDCGATETILHERLPLEHIRDKKQDTVHDDDDLHNEVEALCQEIGTNQVDWVVKRLCQTPSTANVHVIPTDDDEEKESNTSILSLDRILATVTWCSQIWTPVPCRSLGFAIGPFKVLEDPEYFGPNLLPETGSEDDDDDEASNLESNDADNRLAEILDSTRNNGEGIRHAYVAPIYERKHIHIHPNANVHLLTPEIKFILQSCTESQKETSLKLDAAVLTGTTGVVHRALSLMRDVLALPSFRTNSYTQVWIPDAVHGGNSCGTFHDTPEVSNNPFLGGGIFDSRLLPPVDSRLPFYQGGRALQFLQARCAIRGWILAALPLGGNDDVGNGYLLTLLESFIMSLYERGHGGQGEGGAKESMVYSKRYSANSGLNSANLDFLPIQNIEEIVEVMGVGAVPVEDRHNEQLWRGANNGSESHTSGMDEYNARQLLCRDCVEALERGTDKDKGVPSPSVGWFGSHLSLTFLSSNAASSSYLGCGAVELAHPVGGLVYRTLKCEVFRTVVEGRAGVANFIRLIRAAFIAAHLNDIGEKELKLPKTRKKKNDADDPKTPTESQKETSQPTQPFVICVNEILKKKGLTHTLFTRALQNLSGRIKEPQLLGTLVDTERHAVDPRTRHPFVDPEGFPNSFVRGASLLYCRVGVQVEASRESSSQTLTAIAKGVQMQAYAEPVIPEGGIAFAGPITVRVVENEGSFREYVKDLAADGSRRDWGASFLHAKPVTTVKAQTAASGVIETKTTPSKPVEAKASSLDGNATSNAFTESNFHSGGYQAIELIRLTNLTPLLWVRVDPMGLYGGRISVFQPDACLAEQLFHDGDAGAQIDAIRALAERPLRIQGSVKVTMVYDVNVSELPVRVLGDCLRGSACLHSALPHTPVVRSNAALAIAQWQNNKAPASKDSVGLDNWLGFDILVQYFRERFYSNSAVMPTRFTRLSLKKSETEVRQASTAASEGANPSAQPSYDETYQYLDALDDEERKEALKTAEYVETEEDEEYRVRSSVVTAIACIRAKDGLTPPLALQFLETVLESEDAEMIGNVVCSDEELLITETCNKLKAGSSQKVDTNGRDERSPPLSFVSSVLVADALLALCHVSAMPATITDPTTGKTVQSTAVHPLTRLIKCARSWLEWELFRENLRMETENATRSGISGNNYDLIASCAVIALSNLVIAKQSTIDIESPVSSIASDSTVSVKSPIEAEEATARFYVDIFDSLPRRNDLTRAACAQAICCICCAADRFDKEGEQPLGLLTSLEFLLSRICDKSTSPRLRHTLALIMMDACTGKVCSMQRVGAIAGRNDLIASVARFLNGPLGACHGGDNGSAILMTVSAVTQPAANAVNDGARRGMRLLIRAGKEESSPRERETVVRVARFGTHLWRTINGEPMEPPNSSASGKSMGVCAHDGVLRCSLLALWQCIWPKGCYAVLRVQSWKAHEGTQQYRDLGAHEVMQTSDREISAALAEEKSLEELNRMVENEIDRQRWRGEMSQKAYDLYMASKGSKPIQDVAAAEQGIGQPLPPIARDPAFKNGGWIASAAQQRRLKALDGGIAVTKLRLKVKGSD